MTEAASHRIYKLDNVRWLCILLVVVGHFIDQYTGDVDKFKSLFLAIYSFHMPMFFFISGLFQKREGRDSSFNVPSFTFYIMTGYLLKLLTYIIAVIGKGYGTFEFFGGDAIPWFMFVLAAYTLITYLTRNVKPVIVMTAALAIGCICGYFKFIGDFLWLSRIFVFLPFYLAGYYLTAGQVIRFTSKNYVRIPAWIISLIFFVLCFVRLDRIYGLRKLFTGKNPFSNVAIENCSAMHRIICYLLSAVICIAVIAIVPDKKIPLVTGWGGNTISVFFWHRLVLYVFQYTGFLKLLTVTFSKKVWCIFVLLLAALVCMIFSADIFGYPLRKLKQLLKKLKPVWCLAMIAAIVLIGLIRNLIVQII